MDLNDFDPFLADAILLTENVVKKANAEIDVRRDDMVGIMSLVDIL